MKAYKSTISKILLIALIGIAISCIPNEYGDVFPYSPFVQITTPAVKISENAEPAQATVTFQYVGPTLTQDLTVNLGVTLDGPGDDVTLPASTVVIKANEFTGSTVVTFEDNVVNDGNKVITIQMLSTSSDVVSIATPLTAKDKSVVTIVDDDCPFDISEYVGSYKLDMELAADFLFSAGDYPDNTVVLTAGDDPNTLVDPDFGLINTFSEGARDAVAVTIKLDPATLAASMVGDPFDFLDGSHTDNAVVAYNAAPNRRVFTNGDEPGQLSTCSKTFVVHATITREDGSVGQVLTLTYVKQ
ncbi:MAG: hypothetical protein WDO14_24720 [Bacteroidota bacterium]